MKNILYVNSTVRKESRTDELARHVLKQMEGNITEIKEWALYGNGMVVNCTNFGDISGLGVIGAVDQITDVVKISGDHCKLHSSIIISHSSKDIACRIGNMDHMGKAVLCISQSSQRFICSGDIGFNGITVCNIFIGQHFNASFQIHYSTHPKM